MAYLSIYLNDHLAGATVGVQLARRTARANKKHPSGPVLAQLAEDIDQDRETLLDLMGRLDTKPDRIKVWLGWTAEKAGRLKLNGELLRYSPLSRLVELEGLALGVSGKLHMWRAFKQVLATDARLAAIDLDALIERAESQRDRLERLRLAAAEESLKPS
jgi:hypothetical protein